MRRFDWTNITSNDHIEHAQYSEIKSKDKLGSNLYLRV
jgi:hypothetical protein